MVSTILSTTYIEAGSLRYPPSMTSDPDHLRYAPVFSLLGHSRSVTALAFSPDGLQLASASADRTVRIWSLRSGSLVTVLKGHQGGVNDIVWSPCGKYIVSGSDDKTIGVWNTKTVSLAIIRGSSAKPSTSRLTTAHSTGLRCQTAPGSYLLRLLRSFLPYLDAHSQRILR